VIKFVNDLWQVSDFLMVLRFSSPIKLTAIMITEMLLKVTLNTKKQLIILPKSDFNEINLEMTHCVLHGMQLTNG
jgi:hypothetical protein